MHHSGVRWSNKGCRLSRQTFSKRDLLEKSGHFILAEGTHFVVSLAPSLRHQEM
jgi:hypothetical protein